MTKEFAVYKGDELLCFGTAKYCAEKLGLKPRTINWHASAAGKRRLLERKNPEEALTVIVIDPNDDE